MAAKKKSKRLTNQEKKWNAEFKKEMQKKGIIPPNKPKLNRRKFIDEARKEWNERDIDCLIWDIYLTEAISYMVSKTEGISPRASPEAVGVAKTLKLAIRLKQFHDEHRAKGEHKYKVVDQYEYIKDILEA